jgi:hypothetical protein
MLGPIPYTHSRKQQQQQQQHQHKLSHRNGQVPAIDMARSAAVTKDKANINRIAPAAIG